MSHDAIVIGAGISGLACAQGLSAAGFSVTVLESDYVIGGNIRTSSSDGFVYERGPHTFMGSAYGIFDLIDRLGISKAVVEAGKSSNARYIVRNGHAYKIPSGPFSFLGTGLLSWKSKMELIREPWRKSDGNENDTAAEFFARRFGKEAAEVLAGAFVNGVYAGDPATLSAPAAFPLFWGFERTHGSMIRGARALGKQRRKDGLPIRKGLYSFSEGLGHLTTAAAESINGKIITNAVVESVAKDGDQYEVKWPSGSLRSANVVLATPPGQASSIAASLDEDISKVLADVPMSPVAVVHVGFEKKVEKVPNSYGFLAPRGSGAECLGILFPSRLFEGRAPGDLFTAYLGGVFNPGALDQTDDELVGKVMIDLEKLFEMHDTPVFTRVFRHPRAIPQLTLGHLQRRSAIDERLKKHPGFRLAGNYLYGVGVKDAVASGVDAARYLTGTIDDNK